MSALSNHLKQEVLNLRTLAKRMTLMFILIVSMLSLFTTVAFASWTGSFGGSGGSGTVGSGYWHQQMQSKLF